jgi:thiol-disulfide isomerase/thioredoxin
MIAAWLLLAALAVPAQERPGAAKAAEDAALEQALAETGGSQVEYIRALEAHLKKYPFSVRKEEITRVLAQAAVEQKDRARIVRYGVPAIESGSKSLPLLDHVSRALLETGERRNAERAAAYLKTLAGALAAERQRQMEAQPAAAGRGKRLEETEYALGRALLMQARAAGIAGGAAAALDFARRAWEIHPTLEGALERSRWLEQTGDAGGALAAAIEAFVIEDPRAPAELRAHARRRAGELAAPAGGGPDTAAVFAAWDRVEQARAARARRIAAFDPNGAAKQPLEFVLPAVEGPPLDMSGLKGKVVILDFWATWCRPCRGQHPLYEQVKKRFAGRADVVFLAVATDEDRGVVTPFLEALNWSKNNVYYDDGLGTLLRVSSIPTTIVLDRQGAIFSRLHGYIADRFAGMLTERIEGALAAN